jgi:hypothetical protein
LAKKIPSLQNASPCEPTRFEIECSDLEISIAGLPQQAELLALPQDDAVKAGRN